MIKSPSCSIAPDSRRWWSDGRSVPPARLSCASTTPATSSRLNSSFKALLIFLTSASRAPALALAHATAAADDRGLAAGDAAGDLVEVGQAGGDAPLVVIALLALQDVHHDVTNVLPGPPLAGGCHVQELVHAALSDGQGA